jgi:uncharacterized membrane protein
MAARPRHNEIEGITSPGLVLGVRVLVLVALVISGYLASVSLGGGLPVGCGPESDCDKVLGGKWGYWFGIPVSVFAVVVDLLVLVSTLALKPRAPAVGQRRAWAVLVPCSLLLIGAAIWFVAVQVFAVQAVCPYCMVAHGCGLLAGILLLIAAPIRQAPDRLWDLDLQVFVTTRRFKRSSLLALLALTVLIWGQTVFERKTGVVTTIVLTSNAVTSSQVSTQAPAQLATTNNLTSNAPLPVAVHPLSPPPVPPTNPPAVAPRLLPIYNGQFQVNLEEAPVIGSPTNAHAIVSLFDYTCHHCRIMHPRLVEAQRVFSNQLVIVSLPMPLDPGCNQTMSRPNPSHTNACEYARIGLAVWRADRARHREFDEWLFAPERPPPLAEARARAVQLIGAEAFETAVKDPWIEQQLKQSVAIYEVAYRQGQGSMPQLNLGSRVAVGTFVQEDLYRLFEDSFGVKRASP